MSALGVRRGVLALALGVLLVWAYAGMQSGSTLPVGTQIHELRAELAGGRVFKLGEHPDEVLVLNFWATWCGTCKHEIPVLDSLDGRGVHVIGIAIDTMPLAALAERAQALGIHYDVGGDAGRLAQRFRVSVVPTTYVISPSGVVVMARTGVVSEADLRRAVAEARPPS